MNKHLLTIALLAACGSSTPAPAPVVTADPVPMTEPTPTEGAGSMLEPGSIEREQEAAKAAAEKAEQDRKATLMATELAAYEAAKPVFEANCARCHTKGNKLATKKKLDHFDMSTYPFAGHDPMGLGGEIRETLGLTGKKPTMPFDKKGIVKGDDLAKIKAWADAFDASHAGGAHEGHEGHH